MMTNEITVLPLAPATNLPMAGMTAEIMRGVQEVTARVYSAKMCPRDIAAASLTAIKECKNIALAEVALYSYPRGGQTVTGPSIRLIETIAAAYGNIEFGVKEVERRKGESTMHAYAWDYQTNVRRPIDWIQPHTIDTKKGPKPLHDDRDIYSQIMNMGARRMRKTLEDLLPKSLIDACVAECGRTLEGNGDLEGRKKRMLEAFSKEFKVTEEQIRKRVGGKEVRAMSAIELVELGKIYNSIRDGMGKVDDYFETPHDPKKIMRERDAAGKAENAAQAAAPASPAAIESATRDLVEAFDKAEDAGLDPFGLLGVKDVGELVGDNDVGKMITATTIILTGIKKKNEEKI